MQGRLRRFAAECDWEQYPTPKNLAMALTLEPPEILELLQWFHELSSPRNISSTEPASKQLQTWSD